MCHRDCDVNNFIGTVNFRIKCVQLSEREPKAGFQVGLEQAHCRLGYWGDDFELHEYHSSDGIFEAVKVGNKVWLDDAQAFVEELLVLEEGGSEGDTWRLFRLKLPNGERCIIEEEGSNQNLYALHSTPLTDIDWEYDNSTITVSSEAASIDDDSIVETKRSNVTYRSGATADGRELLQFRGETWVYLSGLINYGNDDQWLASAQCPASSLQRYSAPDASFDPKL